MLPFTWSRTRKIPFILPTVLAVNLAAAGPSVANPLSPIWTGAYVGLYGGQLRSTVDMDQISGLNADRVSIGGHVGYNIALSNWVLGIEADTNYSGSSFSYSTAGGGVSTIASGFTGSVRGRVGVGIGPALFYATAGWAWTGISILDRKAGLSNVNADATINGFVYGIGVQAYVLPAISLKFEALRYDYDAERLSVGGGLRALREIDLGDIAVRVGVSIHFR